MLLGGRYETIRELGRGGSGRTYLAEDTYRRGGLKCVIKKIQPSSKVPTVLKQARDRFEVDVQALRELGTHDQIPRLYEHWEQDGDFYVAQEFVDGHDLRQAFSLGERWDEKSLIALLREILDILVIIHDRQVIHQDLKPPNLIRRWKDKKLVLIDFGSIKTIRHVVVNADGEPNITQPVGAAGYMPREQIEGYPHLSSDIYAVGMMGIQALTGYMPTQLPVEVTTGAIQWHDQAQVSPYLRDMLDRMVHPDQNYRYSSAREALEALPALAKPKVEVAATPAPELNPVPTCRMVIEPQFQVAHEFSDGLAAIVVNNQLGYIDRTGQMMIAPTLEFDLASSFREGAYQFSEGMAPLSIGHYWGYIDTTGQMAIAPEYDSAAIFYDGLARVETDHHYGFINHSGKFVVKPWFESAAQTFSEGLAGVQIDQWFGYIDRSGKIVIQPQFDSAGPFRDGLARITHKDKYGFIDKSGQVVIPTEFDVAHTFREGLARVRIDDRYGYINRSGAIIIPPQFEDTFSFTQGLALVRNNDRYGFINPTGAMVIPLQFEDAFPFNEGLAAVKQNGQWGYINLEGSFVIEPQFEDAGSFHEGRARVKRGKGWGYLQFAGG